MERRPVETPYSDPRTPSPIPEQPASPERPHLSVRMPYQENPMPYQENPQEATVPPQNNNGWPQQRNDPSAAGTAGPYASSPYYPPPQTMHTEEWSSQIFDCLTPSNLCITTCFCPCVAFGKTHARLRDPSLRTYDPVNQECFLWTGLCLFSLNGIYQWMGRRDIRNRFKLRGDDLEDFLLSCCCTCCALIQEEKEVERRLQRVDSQGYVRQPEMRMP